MELLTFTFTFLAVGLGFVALWQYRLGRRRARDILRSRDPMAQSATVLKIPGLIERWEITARQAGLNWTARTYVMMLGLGLIPSGLFALIGNVAAAVLIMTGVGLVPWFIVRHRQRARTERFASQFPAALTLAANTIRAGGTLLQAVKAIARQMPDPIGGEFARIDQALKLQVPLGTALEQARSRIGGHEFAAVVVACKVAGQAGADLDQVLESIGREIVEDRQFRAAMRTASSEGRTAAKVVTALPFVGGAWFLMTNPNYFEPMTSTGQGRLLLIGSLVSICIGWVIIQRITDIRTW